MSTRAQIRFATREAGISFNEHPNAIHAQFYKHSDGYPEGLGVDIAWGFGIPDQDICSTCLHKEKQLWDDTLSSINIRGN